MTFRMCDISSDERKGFLRKEEGQMMEKQDPERDRLRGNIPCPVAVLCLHWATKHSKGRKQAE